MSLSNNPSDVVRECLACRNESMESARTYRAQGWAAKAFVETARHMNHMAVRKARQHKARAS